MLIIFTILKRSKHVSGLLRYYILNILHNLFLYNKYNLKIMTNIVNDYYLIKTNDYSETNNVTNLFIPDYSEWSKHAKAQLITYKDTNYLYINALQIISSGDEICSCTFNNVYPGKYKLLFSRYCNDSQAQHCFVKLIKNGNEICNINNPSDNVNNLYSDIQLSANDLTKEIYGNVMLVGRYAYRMNVADSESLYAHSIKYKNNFITSIEFTVSSKEDTFNLQFYSNLASTDCAIAIKDIQLMYIGN